MFTGIPFVQRYSGKVKITIDVGTDQPADICGDFRIVDDEIIEGKKNAAVCQLMFFKGFNKTNRVVEASHDVSLDLIYGVPVAHAFVE